MRADMRFSRTFERISTIRMEETGPAIEVAASSFTPTSAQMSFAPQHPRSAGPYAMDPAVESAILLPSGTNTAE